MTDKSNILEGLGLNYAAPSVTVLDFQNEGILCVSGPDRADNGYGDNIMPEI